MCMEVVKVKTEDNKERYYVADDNGLPVESILKFITTSLLHKAKCIIK